MKIVYTDEFVRKVGTDSYPLIGFWIQLGFIDDMKGVIGSWDVSSTNIHKSNTFIYTDNRFRVSIKVNNAIEIANKTNCVYLYALDGFTYRDIIEFSGPKDKKLYNQLAGVIQFDEDSVDFNHITIFEFTLPEVKCSFKTVSLDGYPQVEHYLSNNTGKTNWYYGDLVDNQLVDKGSGLDKVKDVVSFYAPHELLGSMTIKKSGLMQL